MTTSRRTFLRSGALLLASSPLASVVCNLRAARAQGPFQGFGDLIADPAGILDLPAGFQYRVLSRAGDPLSRGGGPVPSRHDGMAAFSAGPFGTWLVRNHELDGVLVGRGEIGVAAVADHTYDPSAPGGTTTLLLDRQGQLLHHRISLAGTVLNCAGGPTPWRTWLSCEETEAVLQRRHGFVFEVDPLRGGNPEPIIAMGRFKHEAVSFDRAGRAYLTEDTSRPLGCVYRFTPNVPLGGRGSLHAGGVLEALSVAGVSGDLSEVQDVGTRLPVSWIAVPNVNPGTTQTPVRAQVIDLGATPMFKAEGTWQGVDGDIWLVSSYAGGPNAAASSERTAAAHSGQIWRYDPISEQITLIVIFGADAPYKNPDNITASPHGFAIACTDGNENWLLALGDDGSVHPFAFNALNSQEFAGATFTPNGRMLFANLQTPGLTLAIWGPWVG